MQSALRHKTQKPDRLERYGLASGIRSGNEESRKVTSEFNVDRNDFA